MGQRDVHGRAATMGEVARAAGVSQSTVSRSSNGNPRVDADVRRKVERGDPPPRLRAQHGGADARHPPQRTPWAWSSRSPRHASSATRSSPRSCGASAVRSTRGRQRLVLLIAEDRRAGALVSRPTSWPGHVDGIVMYSLHGDDPLPDVLRRRGIPVVVGGLPPRGAHVSFVDTDNVGWCDARRRPTSCELGRRVVATHRRSP